MADIGSEAASTPVSGAAAAEGGGFTEPDGRSEAGQPTGGSAGHQPGSSAAPQSPDERGLFTESDLAARLAEAEERHRAERATLEAELAGLRQEQWLVDTLREASQRAGVEIRPDDERLAVSFDKLRSSAQPGAQEAFVAAVEAVVREETARREAAAEAEALRARVAELEERLANPRRDTFDTGGSRAAGLELDVLSPFDKIRHALGA